MIEKILNNPEHGRIRKLSMTCQLTDGSEYKGGELEFDLETMIHICEMNRSIEYNVKRYYQKVLLPCISFICVA